MTPSNANTSGLEDLIKSRIGQDFEGECHLAEHEAREIIPALVTAASAQARIAELEGVLAVVSADKGILLDCAARNADRATAAEARADRYYDALVQADLTIRAFPGTDQSDVAFIRTAGGVTPCFGSVSE